MQGTVYRVWTKDDEERIMKVAVVSSDDYYKEIIRLDSDQLRVEPIQKVVHVLIEYLGMSRVKEMMDDPGIEIEEETTCWLTKGPIVVRKKREESAISFLQDLSKLLR